VGAGQDPTPLLGRAIAYERMVSSELIEEGEPLPQYDRDEPPPPPPPPPSSQYLRAHPKAPYLKLVVSQESPSFLNFGTGDLLQSMLDAVRHWRGAANADDLTA
jgi:hypothetical protein